MSDGSGASPPQPPKLTSDVFEAMIEKSSLATGQIVVLGMLAGAYIGFGGLFATVALAGADGVLPYGAAQVLAGIVFVTGLTLVVVAGAELFTGNVLMFGPVADQELPLSTVAKALLTVYLANAVGSMLLAALVFSTGMHLAEDGAIAKAAIDIATTKSTIGFGQAMASGILANMLVCLAVWMSYGGSSTGDKIIAVALPIAAFVAAGLEHSVANMYLLPYGWLIANLSTEYGQSEGAVTLLGILGNLVPATIGNLIGGACIALAYWWSYCRRP